MFKFSLRKSAAALADASLGVASGAAHRRTLLATAMVSAVALGMPSTASAYVYGMSHLNVKDFVISPITNLVSIDGFTFTLTNTATRSGVPSVIQSVTCGGTVASNDCAPSPAFALDAPAAEIPIGARGGQNFYGFVGNAAEYSSSDSVIRTAQLVDGVPSSVEQIAEANLLTNGSASANAEMQSTTSWTLNFSVQTGGAFDLDFSADADLRAAISEVFPGFFSTQANVNTTVALTRTGTQQRITWTPDGSLIAADCTSSIAGATCTETADGGGAVEASLNQTLASGVNPSNQLYSYDAADTFNPYGIDIRGLPAGTYSLSLNSVTSTNVRRTVPEPGSLALLGVGLSVLAIGSRRRKQVQPV